MSDGLQGRADGRRVHSGSGGGPAFDVIGSHLGVELDAERGADAQGLWVGRGGRKPASPLGRAHEGVTVPTGGEKAAGYGSQHGVALPLLGESHLDRACLQAARVRDGDPPTEGHAQQLGTKADPKGRDVVLNSIPQQCAHRRQMWVFRVGVGVRATPQHDEAVTRTFRNGLTYAIHNVDGKAGVSQVAMEM